MIQVIRRPGGGWERQADGSKGEKLWHNVRGRRTLTRYGRDNLHDWYDLTIHVPCWEQELANAKTAASVTIAMNLLHDGLAVHVITMKMKLCERDARTTFDTI